MSETISVIIPIYNAEKELKECVNSVLRQTYTDLRILLIDDGSTDRSGEICDRYAARDKRVEVIHQKNKGLVASRMVGIQALTEEGYTTFLDADDFIPLDAIEKMWTCVKKTNVDIVHGKHRRFFGRHLFGKHIYFGEETNNGEKNIKIYTREQLFCPELLAGYFGCGTKNNISFVNIWSKLYRNSLLKKGLEFERPVHFHGEDQVFNLQMFDIVETLAIIPEIVYNYRVGGGYFQV